MKAKEIFNLCGEGGNCPKVLETDEGDYLVQGYVLKSEALKALKAPDGEDIVRLPKEFFEAMLKSLG